MSIPHLNKTTESAPSTRERPKCPTSPPLSVYGLLPLSWKPCKHHTSHSSTSIMLTMHADCKEWGCSKDSCTFLSYEWSSALTTTLTVISLGTTRIPGLSKQQ